MRASTDSLDKFIENENPYDEVPIDTLSRPQAKKSFVCNYVLYYCNNIWFVIEEE